MSDRLKRLNAKVNKMARKDLGAVRLLVSYLKEEPELIHNKNLAFLKDWLPLAVANYRGWVVVDGPGAAQVSSASDDDDDDDDSEDDSDGSMPDLDGGDDDDGMPGRSAPAAPAAAGGYAAAPAAEQDDDDDDDDDEEDVSSSDEEDEEPDAGLFAPDDPPYPPLSNRHRNSRSQADQDRAMQAKMEAADARGAGRTAEAIEKFTESLLLNPSPLTYANRADLLLKSDPPRPSAAVQDCTAALKMNPDSAKSLRIRGTAYRRLGKYEEAAADLRRAMQQDFQPALKEMFDFVQKKMADKQARAVRKQLKREERAEKLLAEKRERRRRAHEVARAHAKNEAKRRAKEDKKRAKEAASHDDGYGYGGGGGGMGGGGPPGSPDMGAMMDQVIHSDPQLSSMMRMPGVRQAWEAAKPGFPQSLNKLMQSPDPAVQGFCQALVQKVQSMSGGGGGMGGGGMGGGGMGGGGYPGGGLGGGYGGGGGGGGGYGGGGPSFGGADSSDEDDSYSDSDSDDSMPDLDGGDDEEDFGDMPGLEGDDGELID